MRLTINSEHYELPDGVTVSYLLQYMNISTAKIAVEVNHRIVPRHTHSQFSLHDRDRVEIIQAVGGG